MEAEQADTQQPEVQLITTIAELLTGDPKCFEVKRSIDNRGVLINLNVDATHLASIIGKQGSTANAMRTLLRPLGRLHNSNFGLKINERVSA